MFLLISQKSNVYTKFYYSFENGNYLNYICLRVIFLIFCQNDIYITNELFCGSCIHFPQIKFLKATQPIWHIYLYSSILTGLHILPIQFSPLCLVDLMISDSSVFLTDILYPLSLDFYEECSHHHFLLIQAMICSASLLSHSCYLCMVFSKNSISLIFESFKLILPTLPLLILPWFPFLLQLLIFQSRFLPLSKGNDSLSYFIL